MLLTEIRDYIASNITKFRPVSNMARAHGTGRCNLCKKNTSDFIGMDNEWLNPFAPCIPYVTKMINICAPCYIKETWESIKLAEKIKDIEAYKSIRLLALSMDSARYFNSPVRYDLHNKLKDFGQQ
jgi:hypothetical protein